MSENIPNLQQKPNKSYTKESAQVLSVAFELGFIIALPIVAFALGGKWLDQKEHTNYFLFIGIIAAVLLTSVVIYRRFAALADKLREAAQLKKETQNEPKEIK
ncbi:MAG: hypothetical protein JWO40_646 [Candidatus Doudnabacteria bacterium]|nr:hypothetical protein [Candidatus Doudnabacteria bacterium]